jgi:hypothetical protein
MGLCRRQSYSWIFRAETYRFLHLFCRVNSSGKPIGFSLFSVAVQWEPYKVLCQFRYGLQKPRSLVELNVYEIIDIIFTENYSITARYGRVVKVPSTVKLSGAET